MAYVPLKKQMKMLQKNHVPYVILVSPVKDEYHWECLFNGPSDSPYSGGIFKIAMYFPSSFPEKPPTVKFVTLIYHPNVSGSGLFLIPSFSPGKWSKSFAAVDIIDAMWKMLAHPEVDDPVYANDAVSEDYKKNKDVFVFLARSTTEVHATGFEG